MYIFGAGGQAKVISSYMMNNSINVSGFVVSKITNDKFMGHQIINEKQFSKLSNQDIIIGIGNNKIRKRISKELNARYSKFIHPSAIVVDTLIDEGTVVFANAVINVDATIGKHCIINTGAIVEHDCKIEDYAHISPNATLTGGVLVGEGTHIGAGAVVIPNVKIGKWVTVGAGSVVIKDVPDYAVVVGNPAKIIKYNDEN